MTSSVSLRKRSSCATTKEVKSVLKTGMAPTVTHATLIISEQIARGSVTGLRRATLVMILETELARITFILHSSVTHSVSQ